MSNLFYLTKLENKFKERLGLILLLINKKEIAFNYSITLGTQTLKYNISCRIKNRTSNSIDYRYTFYCPNPDPNISMLFTLNFIEFYFYLYNKFQDSIAQNSDFIVSVIFAEIFEQITSDKRILLYYSKLFEYDTERENNELKYYLEQNYNDMIKSNTYIKFKHKKIGLEVDLYKINNHLLKVIEEKYESAKTTYSAKTTSYKPYLLGLTIAHKDIFKAEIKEDTEYAHVFELFYKQILVQPLKSSDESRHLIGLDYTQPLKENIPLYDGLFTNHIDITLGCYLQFFHLLQNEPHDFKLNPTDELHTQYTIGDLNFKGLSKKEQNFFFYSLNWDWSYYRNVKNFIDTNSPSYTNKDFTPLYKEIIKILGAFPKLYFNGLTLGIISLELPRTSITFRAKIFDLSSRSNEQTIFLIEKKGLKIEQKDKILKLITKTKELFDYYFDFYPYHPSFFNRYNNYLTLYTNSVLKLPNITMKYYNLLEKQYVMVGKKKTDLFFGSPNASKELWENRIDSLLEIDFFDSLKLKILDVFKYKLYLWIPAYIEKYIHLVNKKISLLSVSLRKKEDHLRYYFRGFLDSINKMLSSENEKISILHKVYQIDIENEVILFTEGLYLIFIYNIDKMELRFFKLNCVSFNPFELKIIDNSIEQEKVPDITASLYKVESNQMYGVKIENIDLNAYHRLRKRIDNHFQFLYEVSKSDIMIDRQLFDKKNNQYYNGNIQKYGEILKHIKI